MNAVALQEVEQLPFEQLIGNADRLLYRAKGTGRNNVQRSETV